MCDFELRSRAALKSSKASKSEQDSECESGCGSNGDSPTPPHGDAGVDPMHTESYDDEPGGKENYDEEPHQSAPPVPLVQYVQAIHKPRVRKSPRKQPKAKIVVNKTQAKAKS